MEQTVNRHLMQQLLAWKEHRNRKPLLILGARQVGKSWLMAEFGTKHYDKTASIDLADNERMRMQFAGDFDVERVISAISVETGVDITPTDTLIIIDEIQTEPRAVIALKYFCERAPEYHIVTAGSLMGVALHEGDGFPVGKVDTLSLHPLSFQEFLEARGETLLARSLVSNDTDINQLFTSKLVGYLKEYMVVGGMPAVVADFCEHHDYNEIRRLQNAILDDYDRDFSKHAPLRILEKMRLVWASIPTQLARENRKFVFGLIREGARARDFEEAIQWLIDYGALRKVPRVSAIKKPLQGYTELQNFKLFTLDVGLTSAMAQLDPSIVLDGDELFTEFKGALTEQYVEQQLEAAGFKPYYWSSDSDAEVDLIVEVNGTPLPIEVKAGENLRSKSLKSASERFNLEKVVRTSLSPYRDEGWLTNIPLWAINQIKTLANVEKPSAALMQ
jgi:predicted AAA+ superfamily ATPase